ncbi:MAG: winged helix-turn-helix domain-containing protein [Candidatus Zhuqueibacterota bacterium]
MKEKLSSELARKIILHAQLLDGRADLPEGKPGAEAAITQLGYVQIDPLQVVQRTHHHVLWTRVPGYRPDDLDELLSDDRRIFEYWGHANAYLPIDSYRYFLPKMHNFDSPSTPWAKQMLDRCKTKLEPVLERIRAEGAMSSAEFPADDPKDKVEREAIKTAFEYLFWRGDVMISSRNNFIKMYDLTGRVLPENIDTRFPSEEEAGLFFVRTALQALGVATEKEIRLFMQAESARDRQFSSSDKKVISSVLMNLAESREVAQFEIGNENKSVYFGFSNVLEKVSPRENNVQPIHLLSPFDNLIIQRERLKKLFNFNYTMECYVPAAKRKVGYYVMPILWGTEFIGRFDPKADRKNYTLVINNLAFEPTFANFEACLPELSAKFWDMAQFNECNKIQLEKIWPERIKNEVSAMLQ